MTSGNRALTRLPVRLRPRPELWLLILWLAGSPAMADTGEADLAGVLDSLARDTPGRLAFTEIREDPMLEAPRTFTGYLEFHPPDTLVRAVLTPRAETVRIRDNHLVVERGGELRRELNLDEQPPLAGFVTAFRALMGNDPESLEYHYEIELSGNADGWRLALRPRDRSLGRLLLDMEITGGQGLLQSVRIREAGGYESLMRLEPAERP